MLNNSEKIQEIYEQIQRKIFFVLPEKWDELYLYASIIDRLGNVQTGEMYFYFLPKGIFKRKYVNVYEVPSKYDIEEDEYMQAVEDLYNQIKLLREECISSGQKLWSNLTISIKNSRFKIEYNYDNLIGGQEAYYDHHVYWRYKYLHIEPHSKKEKQSIEKYLANKNNSTQKNEEYDMGLYEKRPRNVITYDTTEFKSTQRVEYLATKPDTQRIRNQILSDKFTKI